MKDRLLENGGFWLFWVGAGSFFTIFFLPPSCMKLTFIYRRWENSMRGFMSMVCGHWFTWEGSISLATNQQPGPAKPHCKADQVRGFGLFFHRIFGWQIDSFWAEGAVHCQVTRVACFFSCMVKVWERERERERGGWNMASELPFSGPLGKMMNSSQTKRRLSFISDLVLTKTTLFVTKT